MGTRVQCPVEERTDGIEEEDTDEGQRNGEDGPAHRVRPTSPVRRQPAVTGSMASPLMVIPDSAAPGGRTQR